jgi:sugar lactone lactonase YvrE
MRMSIVTGALFVHASILLAQSYSISTFAGGGRPPSAVPAGSVRVAVSGPVVIGGAGEVYFSSGNAVMKVDVNGILTRFAGTGAFGTAGDGGPAVEAQLAWPAGLALDNAGNLFIADNASHRIRKVTPDGNISTVVGSTARYSGDGGPAAAAQLNWPTGLAFDAAGNLYIADTANQVVRKVSSKGIITTVATGLNQAEGVAADAAGNLYIADSFVYDDGCGDFSYTGSVLKVTPDGTASTIVKAAPGAGVLSPKGIAADAAGNLYVADAISDEVLRISSSGAVTTAAGNAGAQVYACPAEYVNFKTQLICPEGVAVDRSGNLYVSDTGHGRIARISPQGDASNVVGDGVLGNYWGDGGKGADAGLDVPLGVAVDGAGNVYISDTKNSRVRKVTPAGVISTVAGTGISGFSGDGGPAISAQMRGPSGLTLDAAGNLYIADWTDNRIRKVAVDGTITTVAGRGDTNPPLGDGGKATDASLAGPFGVAVDGNGNLYIADTYYYLIRKVSPAGIITTAAGHNFYSSGPIDVGFPTSVVSDAAGNLYIVSESRVLKLAPDGTLTTVAGTVASGMAASGDGGPATSAVLQGAFAVAVDGAGNLYIAGGNLTGYFGGSGSVRKITRDGIISTIAGNGVSGYSGDGGPAAGASFSPATAGIAVDGSGNVYVADVFNNVIRVLNPASK